MACCDCALVHDFQFDIHIGGKRFHKLSEPKFLALMKELDMSIMVTADRNNKATANRRRSKEMLPKLKELADEHR